MSDPAPGRPAHHDPAQAAAEHDLLAEGDRLARLLTQTLHVTVADAPRVTLLGRSLAANLVQGFIPALEQVSRHAGTPRRALLVADDPEQPVILVADEDGHLRHTLPVRDLLHALLLTRGHLHPAMHSHLQNALRGDEHHMTTALIRCLRSPAMLQAMTREIQALLK